MSFHKTQYSNAPAVLTYDQKYATQYYILSIFRGRTQHDVEHNTKEESKNFVQIMNSWMTPRIPPPPPPPSPPPPPVTGEIWGVFHEFLNMRAHRNLTVHVDVQSNEKLNGSLVIDY